MTNRRKIELLIGVPLAVLFVSVLLAAVSASAKAGEPLDDERSQAWITFWFGLVGAGVATLTSILVSIRMLWPALFAESHPRARLIRRAKWSLVGVGVLLWLGFALYMRLAMTGQGTIRPLFMMGMMAVGSFLAVAYVTIPAGLLTAFLVTRSQRSSERPINAKHAQWLRDRHAFYRWLLVGVGAYAAFMFLDIGVLFGTASGQRPSGVQSLAAVAALIGGLWLLSHIFSLARAIELPKRSKKSA